MLPMESSSSKRIMLHLHLDRNQKIPVPRMPTDKVQTLQTLFEGVDFYYHGDKLDTLKTFKEQGLHNQCIIHTYSKDKPMVYLNPISFQFFSGNISKMKVPVVWTLKRTA